MSEKSNSNTTSGGISFLAVLFLLFLTLKLTNVIDWSWWWITAPLWGGWAFVLACLAVMGIVALIVVWIESRTP